MGQNDGINTVVQSFNFDIQGVSASLLNLKETKWDPVQIITSGRALPMVVPLLLSKHSTANHLRYGDRIKVVSTDGVKTVPDIIPGDFLITMANFGIDSSNKTTITFVPAINSDTVFKLGFSSIAASLDNVGTFADKSTNTHTVTPAFWEAANDRDTDSEFRVSTVAPPLGISSATPFDHRMGGDFAGTTGHYVETPEHADLAVGTGDFTFEGWVYPSTTMPNGTYYYRDKAETGFNLGYNLDSTSQGLVVGRKTPSSTAASNYALEIGPGNPTTVVPATGTGGTKSTYTEGGVTYVTHTYDTATESETFVANAMPTGTEIEFLIWGAGGGAGRKGGWSLAGGDGGGGGYVSGKKTVTIGDSFAIVVGENSAYSSLVRGFGGGGPNANTDTDNQYGSGGGGYSGVFTDSLTHANALIIAGGGGGSGVGNGTANLGGGGGGGGLIGQDGLGYTAVNVGKGGTQTSGGALTSGYSSGPTVANRPGALEGGAPRYGSYGAGGGGGYYGGSGGAYYNPSPHVMAGGGGGSSYTHSSITNVVHLQGNYVVPGNNTSALRGTAGRGGEDSTGAGALGNPGKVIIRYPLSSVPTWGDAIDVSIPATGMADAATVAYTISGITSNDINGDSLTGTATVANEVATFSFTLQGVGSAKTLTITATPTAGTISTSFTMISGELPTNSGLELSNDWPLTQFLLTTQDRFRGAEFEENVRGVRVNVHGSQATAEATRPLSTTENPFGGNYSYYVPPTASAQITCSMQNTQLMEGVSGAQSSTDGNFEFSGWFYSTSNDTSVAYFSVVNGAAGGTAAYRFALYHWQAGTITLDWRGLYAEGHGNATSYTRPLNKWYFVKVIKRDNAGTASTRNRAFVYMDGVLILTTNSSTTNSTNPIGGGVNDQIRVGGLGAWSTGYNWGGYIYDFKVRKGYTSSDIDGFSVPTTYGGDSDGNTSVILHLSGSYGYATSRDGAHSYNNDSVIFDTNGPVVVETAKGTKITTYTPFRNSDPVDMNPTTGSALAEITHGSVYFNRSYANALVMEQKNIWWFSNSSSPIHVSGNPNWKIGMWIKPEYYTDSPSQPILDYGGKLKISQNAGYIRLQITGQVGTAGAAASLDFTWNVNTRDKIKNGVWSWIRIEHYSFSGTEYYRLYINGKSAIADASVSSSLQDRKLSNVHVSTDIQTLTGVNGLTIGNYNIDTSSNAAHGVGFHGWITDVNIGGISVSSGPSTTYTSAASNIKLQLQFRNSMIYDRTGQATVIRGSDDAYRGNSWLGHTPFTTHFVKAKAFKGNNYLKVGPVTGNTFKQFGSSDFCIEMFIFPTHATEGWIFSDRSLSNPDMSVASISLKFNANQGLQMYYATSTSATAAFNTNDYSAKAPLFAWTHVALVRKTNTVFFCINGRTIATQTLTGTYPHWPLASGAGVNESALRIGQQYDSVSYVANDYFSGFISQFRMVKGSSVYNLLPGTNIAYTRFTPPTSLVAIANTVLFTCTNDGTTTDNAAGSGAPSAVDVTNAASISTGFPEAPLFPIPNPSTTEGSLYLDSANTAQNWVAVTQYQGRGTEDFTWEVWVWKSSTNSTTYSTIADDRSSGTNGLRFGYREGSSYGLYVGHSSLQYSGVTLNTGEWYHISVVRKTQSVKMYLNGVDINIPNPTTVGGYNHTSNKFWVGRDYNNLGYKWNGFLFEIQVLDYAKYSVNYTSPTRKFQRLTAAVAQPTGPDTAQYGDKLVYNYYVPNTYADGYTSGWNATLNSMPESSIKTFVDNDGTANNISFVDLIFKTNVAQGIIALGETGPSRRVSYNRSGYIKYTLIGEQTPVGVTNQTLDFPTAAFWGETLYYNYVDTALAAGTMVNYSISGITDSQVSGAVPSASMRVSSNGVASLTIKTLSTESATSTLIITVTKPGGGTVSGSTSIQSEFKLSSNHLLAKQKWQHIAATRSTNDIKIFVDGVQVASSSTTNTFGTNSTRYRIGADNDGSLNYSGETLDFRITTGSALYSGTITFTTTVVGGNPSNHPYHNVGSSNKYAINGSTATSDVTLSLTEGSTYRFDQSDSSNSNHPLRFSTTANGTHGSGSEYTTGVTTNGTPGSSGAYTEITVAAGAPTLYYYCTNHSAMGWTANTPVSSTTASFSTPTYRLTSKTNTKLLTFQRGVEQRTEFADYSSLNHALIGTGPVNKYNDRYKADAYAPAENFGSFYFSSYATSYLPYLKIPHHTDFNLAGVDWTFECWIKKEWAWTTADIPNILTKISNAYNTSASSSYSFGLKYTASGGAAINAFFTAGSVTNTPTMKSIDFNARNSHSSYGHRDDKWIHLAWRFEHVSSNEGTIIIFINGSPSSAYTVTIADNTDGLIIGYTTASSLRATTDLMNTYLADVRLVKGTALGTTTAYPVPTKPLTAISGTSLLLNFDSADVYDLASNSAVLLMQGCTTNTTHVNKATVSLDCTGTKHFRIVPPDGRIHNQTLVDYPSIFGMTNNESTYTVEFSAKFTVLPHNYQVASLGWYNGSTGVGTDSLECTWMIYYSGSTFRLYAENNWSSWSNADYIDIGPAVINTWYDFRISRNAILGFNVYINDQLVYEYNGNWEAQYYHVAAGIRNNLTFGGPGSLQGYYENVKIYTTTFDNTTNIFNSETDQALGNTKLNNPAGHTFPSTMFDDSPNMAVAKISYPLTTIHVSNATLSQYKTFKGTVVPIIVFSTENSLQAVVAADGTVHYEETTPISDATLEDNPRTPDDQVSNARIWY